jgi:hypothetical protein
VPENPHHYPSLYFAVTRHSLGPVPIACTVLRTSSGDFDSRLQILFSSQIWSSRKKICPSLVTDTGSGPLSHDPQSTSALPRRRFSLPASPISIPLDLSWASLTCPAPVLSCLLVKPCSWSCCDPKNANPKLSTNCSSLVW